ncbi:MAG TPA: pyridoxamine 5'-phosphate oxidase family protein, partial [Acidimicrobiia bacterium]|nr:pyridoxamine 5'-phosphate oxidase family protein [Acidimicrobiia bacterium]
MTAPEIDRPSLPDGYGVESASRYVAWDDVVSRLVESLHYWLATTRPDGRPHVIPRWGVWLGDRFWYDGSPDTIHARNLARDPSCVLHLESGSQVTILEGK